MISGLGSIKVINNLPLLHLLVGTLIYHIYVRVKFLIHSLRKKTQKPDSYKECIPSFKNSF